MFPTMQPNVPLHPSQSTNCNLYLCTLDLIKSQLSQLRSQYKLTNLLITLITSFKMCLCTKSKYELPNIPLHLFKVQAVKCTFLHSIKVQAANCTFYTQSKYKLPSVHLHSVKEQAAKCTFTPSQSKY